MTIEQELQADNHTSTPPLSFLQARWPSFQSLILQLLSVLFSQTAAIFSFKNSALVLDSANHHAKLEARSFNHSNEYRSSKI